MVAYFTDDFNRANGSVGSNYTATNGSLGGGSLPEVIDTSRASTTVGNCGCYVNTIIFPSDQYVKCKVYSSATSSPALTVRARLVSGETDGYTFFLGVGSTSVSIYRIRNNNSSILLASTTLGAAVQQGDTASLEIQGNNLTAKINNVTVLTTSDSNYVIGQPAFYIATGAGEGIIDDLEAGGIEQPINIARASGGTSSAIDTTGATLLVASVGASTAVGTPTDSKGNTWTPLTQRTGGGARCRLYYVLSPTVGSGHTFTDNATNGGTVVAAYSGFDEFQTETGSGGSASSSYQPGSITPNENGALLILGGYGGGVSNLSSGLMLVGQQDGGGGTVSMSNYIQTVAAAINPTLTESSGGDFAIAMAAFLPSAASSPFRRVRRLLSGSKYIQGGLYTGGNL